MWQQKPACATPILIAQGVGPVYFSQALLSQACRNRGSRWQITFSGDAGGFYGKQGEADSIPSRQQIHASQGIGSFNHQWLYGVMQLLMFNRCVLVTVTMLLALSAGAAFEAVLGDSQCLQTLMGKAQARCIRSGAGPAGDDESSYTQSGVDQKPATPYEGRVVPPLSTNSERLRIV